MIQTHDTRTRSVSTGQKGFGKPQTVKKGDKDCEIY